MSTSSRIRVTAIHLAQAREVGADLDLFPQDIAFIRTALRNRAMDVEILSLVSVAFDEAGWTPDSEGRAEAVALYLESIGRPRLSTAGI